MLRKLLRGPREAEVTVAAEATAAVIDITPEVSGEAVPVKSLGEVRVGRRGLGELFGLVGAGAFLGAGAERMADLSETRTAVDQANEYWGAQLRQARADADAAAAQARTEGGHEAFSAVTELDNAAGQEAREIRRILNGGITYSGATVFRGELQERDPRLDVTEWYTTPYPLVLAAQGGTNDRLAKLRTYANGTVGVELVHFDSATMELVNYDNGSGDISSWTAVDLQVQTTHNSGPAHPVVVGWDQSGQLLPVAPAYEMPATMK